MLELTNISFAYAGNKTMAVRDVSLHIPAGEFTAVAGRNGSGKTTLTKLIMSLLKPSSGSIKFRGQDTKKLTSADMAHCIGYVFQNPDRQIFRDTVAEEVAYGPRQLEFSPDRIRAAVEKALAVTGLEEVAKAYPKTLTKGLKQKVAIASALAMEPKVLILDEPTSGQDVQSGLALMELLTELNVQGCSIILVTHNMELLARYASRAIIMHQGEKAFDGPVGELFGQSRDIGCWGLREPATTLISRNLQKYGAELTDDPLILAQNMCRLLGGKAHA